MVIVAAWHDSDVRPAALLAAVYLAAITVLVGIIVWKLVT